MASCLPILRPAMSKWQDEKAERNRQAITRLTKALPDIFPPAVLARALGRPFVPPTPRLAIDSYWRAHPLRADRLARALAARSARAGWLDLAPRWRPQERTASHVPDTAGALSRTQLCTRRRILLRVRAAGLSFRLARRSLERRTEQERDLALRLRDRLAVLECAKRRGASIAAAAGATLRRIRRTAVEDRRGRPPRAAVSGVGPTPRDALAGAPRLLGPAKPAAYQSRRSRCQKRERGARPPRRARPNGATYSLISPRLMLVPSVASRLFDRPLAKICKV